MFSFNFSTYPAFPLFLRGILPYAPVFAACNMFLHPVLYFYYHFPRYGEYSVHVLLNAYVLFFPCFLCMNIPGLYIRFHKIRKNNRERHKAGAPHKPGARKRLSSRWEIFYGGCAQPAKNTTVSNASIWDSKPTKAKIAKLRLHSAGLRRHLTFCHCLYFRKHYSIDIYIF